MQTSVRRVTQEHTCSNLRRAATRFGQIGSDGSIPIVICPRRRTMGMFLTVPTGVSAVVQRSGATIGEWKPGMHFAPPQYRVVAMTPRQACTFNYDVLACPTKDNVMVEVDVTLVFRITSAIEFVYKLGACKFDEGLKAVAEEAIRSMVRLIPHHNIYELRGSGADELLSVLNDKFSMFGISFVNATITDVKLPSEVAEALQNSTMVDQRLREHERKHEFQLKLVHDKHDLELKDLILSNERFEQSMNADMERTSIDLDAKCLEVDRKRKLAAIEASKLQSVALKNAEANLANDAVKAETAAQVSINKAKADAARKRLETEHHSQHSIIRSEARLVEAEAASRRLKIEAGVEAATAEKLKDVRNHSLNAKAIKNLSDLASNSRIMINGKDGDQLVRAIATADNNHGLTPLL